MTKPNTCLDLQDNKARENMAARLIKTYGYLPVIGPNIADMHFAAGLFDELRKEYFGYRWVVEVRNGVVSVWNESLSSSFGWRGYANDFDNDGRVIKMVGGQFLERYDLPRRGIQVDLVRELPRNLRGEKQFVPGGDERHSK